MVMVGEFLTGLVGGISLLQKQKNHPARWLFRRFSKPASFWTVVTGFSGAQSPNMSFQCSLTQAITSRTLVS